MTCQPPTMEQLKNAGLDTVYELKGGEPGDNPCNGKSVGTPVGPKAGNKAYIGLVCARIIAENDSWTGTITHYGGADTVLCVPIGETQLFGMYTYKPTVLHPAVPAETIVDLNKGANVLNPEAAFVDQPGVNV